MLAIIICFASVIMASGKCFCYLVQDYGLITKCVSILGIFRMAIFLDGSYLVEHTIKNFYSSDQSLSHPPSSFVAKALILGLVSG